MSADQELAVTGASGIIPLAFAGVLMVVGGVAALWRRIATRAALQGSGE